MRHRHSLATRALAYALTVLITWAQLAPLASAVPTDLGDAPPSTRGRAKPNMIMAVDDSASMDSEYSPVRGFSTNDGAAWWNVNVDSFVGCGAADEAVAPAAGGCNAALTDPAQMLSLETGVAAAKINFNIAGGASGTWKKYVYLFPNGQCGANCATRGNGDSDNDHFAIPPTREFAFFRSPVFNAQYYNPAIRYDPWRPYNDGATTI
ncbi:MAG: hypothetical protein KIT73_08980, partial [Burkholderiales bacterium]|nr:hypothetical protein [Burkholderiales bacterium]